MILIYYVVCQMDTCDVQKLPKTDKSRHTITHDQIIETMNETISLFRVSSKTFSLLNGVHIL